jgi:hypothetical protein
VSEAGRTADVFMWPEYSFSDAEGAENPITRTTFPTCRAHYPGRITWVRVSIASPRMQPSPNRRVGIRIVTFEACSGFTTRYGPPDRSAAQGDLCHEAPALPVTRPSRSSASRSIDNCLDGFFLH